MEDSLATYFDELSAGSGFRLAFREEAADGDPSVLSLRRAVRVHAEPGDKIEISLGALRATVAWRDRRLEIPRWLLSRSWQAPGASHLDRFCRTIQSLLLSLNGHIALHGNVLEIGPGRAAALLGPSGAGKSTLTYGLNRAGTRALSDDLCAIHPTTLKISYYSRFLQLGSQSLQLFGLPVGPRKEKELLPIPPSEGAHQLSEIWFLRPLPQTEVRAKQMDLARGCFLMMQHTLIDPRLWGVTLSEYFNRCIEMAQRLKTRSLSYDKSVGSLEKMVELIQGREILQRS